MDRKEEVEDRKSTALVIKDQLRRTVARMKGMWVLLEALLFAVTAAVVAVWLTIPDSNTAEITLSFTVAIGGLLLFAWAQSFLFGMVRRKGRTRVAAWKGALLLLALLLIYVVVAAFFDAGQNQDVSRAARWSLLPQLEAYGTADTWMKLQACFWWLLRCMVIMLFVPFAVEGAGTGLRGRWLRRAARLLLHRLFWAGVLLCAAAGTLVTEGLLNFRPHLPVFLEAMLAVAKGLGIFVVDAGVFCFGLSLVATLLRDEQRSMPEKGEPRTSRTGGIRMR